MKLSGLIAAAALTAGIATNGMAAGAVNMGDADLTSVTVDDMRQMRQVELDEIYSLALPGEMPDGESQGTAVFFPGSLINTPAQLLASLFWQGKIFDTEDGVLVNKVFGFHAIKAQIYFGDSLFDGKESIIIDYSNTSLVARRIRDEIREVSPGVYLGRAYLRTLLGDFMVVNFILNFN
jgi:hypothetical protein